MSSGVKCRGIGEPIKKVLNKQDESHQNSEHIYSYSIDILGFHINLQSAVLYII